jgi:hypothetical protein
VEDGFIGFGRDHVRRWRRSILVLPTAWRKDSSFCWYRIGTVCCRRVLRWRSAELYVDVVGDNRPYGRTLAANAESNVIQDLLIGIVALTIAAGLFVIALPNRYGESPRFLQFYAAPMVYPAAVLFLALGVAELISWAATMNW